MRNNNTSKRVDFSKIRRIIDYPDFLDVQLQSYKDFFQLETAPENRTHEGLYKVFMENFPISDSRENFILEFVDYTVDPPKYNVNECVDRGLTFVETPVLSEVENSELYQELTAWSS